MNLSLSVRPGARSAYPSRVDPVFFGYPMICRRIQYLLSIVIPGEELMPGNLISTSGFRDERIFIFRHPPFRGLHAGTVAIIGGFIHPRESGYVDDRSVPVNRGAGRSAASLPCT
jgi:hypothetical protein